MVSSHLFNDHGQANPNPRGSVWKNIDVVTIAFQTFHRFFYSSIPILSSFPFLPKIRYLEVSFLCILKES